MKLLPHLKDYSIILASQSPRRKELLASLGISFTVFTLPNIDENFPKNLDVLKVAEFLSNKKADTYMDTLLQKNLLITADTVVCNESTVFGKPENKQDARRILKILSGQTHKVITGVTILSLKKRVSFSGITDVTFSKLDNAEIEYYIENFKPYDKAGAYGIQEWIGHIGVECIQGSYFNVMGLPIQKLYAELKNF